MKVCTTCNIKKDESEFNTKKTAKDGLAPSCKVCHRARSKRWYNHNRQKVITRSRTDTKIIRERVGEYKQSLGCVFCGETYHKCLHFHHIDPSQKEHEVSDLISCGSWSRIEREIQKCVIVCSNCHMKLHDGVLTLPDLHE